MRNIIDVEGTPILIFTVDVSVSLWIIFVSNDPVMILSGYKVYYHTQI